MARIVYLGDEVTAAGFRLAGVETRVIGPGDAATALHQERDGGADCVLLSRTLAEFVPTPLLQQLQEAVEPLFAVVPDINDRGGGPDLAQQVRNALGIES